MAEHLSSEVCQTVAEEVLGSRDWRLAYEGLGIAGQLAESFVSEVLEEARRKQREAVRIQPLRQVVARATITCYCRRLYQACRAHRTLRQQRAWQELSAYLLTVACWKMPDDPAQAQECAQQALLSLWRRFSDPQWAMERPGALLRYAENALLREVWRIWKQQGKKWEREKPLERAGQRHEEQGDREADERFTSGEPSPDPERDALRREADQRVAAAIRACLRSEQQATVIIETFLNDRSVLEIARQLDTSPENVYVLRSRAIRRLQECPELLETLADVLSD
ncbi:MAG: sigma-70 family RNA polymerase sigma factor [Anaerolineae bacterium]|nr:sigma-70 family RNA polymerase sigma factor [Anaerolineae bacterium]